MLAKTHHAFACITCFVYCGHHQTQGAFTIIFHLLSFCLPYSGQSLHTANAFHRYVVYVNMQRHSYRALCQQSKGIVNTEQQPATVGGQTAQRALSPKWTPFQTGPCKQSQVQKMHTKEESATNIVCDCEAIDYLRFHHRGHYFTKPSYYHNAPIRKVLCFISSTGLIEGLTRRGSTINLRGCNAST
jgi:hypothetical protein